MKKMIFGVFAGAGVFFLWMCLSWMLFPWREHKIKVLPEEQLIMDTLRVVVKEPGLYSFPFYKTVDGQMDEKGWMERHSKGPIGYMAYFPGGKAPLSAGQVVAAFLTSLGAAFIAMLLLMLSRDRVQAFIPRVGLVTLLGLLVWVVADVSLWNWFLFPMNVTLLSLFDDVMAFGLMGFFLANAVPSEKK